MLRISSLRLFSAAFLLSLFTLGCGGSEETVAEDEFLTDTGVMDEPLPGEVPYQEEIPAQEQQSGDDSVNAMPVEPAPVPEGPSAAELQSELDAIKSENMQLKEKNSTLQQTNKTLTNKVSDLEAANAALAKANKKPEPAPMPSRSTVAGASSPEMVRAYEGAVNKTRNKNYREAMSQFQALLNSGVKDDLADNCHYWLGECNFHLKEYSQAIQQFQLVQGFKYSEKKDDAQVMIARSYEMLGDRSKARSEYQKLVDMYPTSEYVKRARAKLR